MAQNKNVFVKIDEFIFQKLDLIKNDTHFSKMHELISSLEEDQQKLLIQVLTFVLILFPFLFASVLWYGNHKQKKNIAVKNNILEQVSLLNGNKNALNDVSSNYLAPYALSGQEELDNKLRNISANNKIEPTKIQIMAFNQISASSNMTKVEATIRFREFGTLDFANVMRALTETERFKISRINLLKNANTNLLQGEVLLFHMGKNPNF